MSVAMEDGSRRRRITVDEYHRMTGAGLLAPDARVELIEGEIVDMPPIGSRHAAAVNRLAELFHAAIGPRAIVQCQGPVRLGDLSEVQPDFAILARREDFYEARHPTAADILLAVEVSDSTLRFDLHTKAALYAAHGIRELWVFDSERAELHVLRGPAGRTYSDVIRMAQPSAMPLPVISDVSVDLTPLFRAV
jgi:Uma2 family endonuclease